VDQIEALAIWLASLSPALPFHVMGYIPVPGQPFARPTVEQMDAACATAARHLKHVQRSHLTTAEALDLSARDDRFASRRIA
jgi:pyruvate-formate lyase-activating enzyme